MSFIKSQADFQKKVHFIGELPIIPETMIADCKEGGFRLIGKRHEETPLKSIKLQIVAYCEYQNAIMFTYPDSMSEPKRKDWLQLFCVSEDNIFTSLLLYGVSKDGFLTSANRFAAKNDGKDIDYTDAIVTLTMEKYQVKNFKPFKVTFLFELMTDRDEPTSDYKRNERFVKVYDGFIMCRRTIQEFSKNLKSYDANDSFPSFFEALRILGYEKAVERFARPSIAAAAATADVQEEFINSEPIIY